MWLRTMLFFVVLALMWAATFGGTIQSLSPGMYRVIYVRPVRSRPIVCMMGLKIADPIKMEQAVQYELAELARQKDWDAHSKAAFARFQSMFRPPSTFANADYFVQDGNTAQLIEDQFRFRLARAYTDWTHFIFEAANFAIALALAWVLPLKWAVVRQQILHWRYLSPAN